MLVRKSVKTATAASGSASVEETYSGGWLKNLSISPATGSTTYTVTLTVDVNGTEYTVYTDTSNTGASIHALDLAISGTVTVYITSASVDEAFTVYLAAIEQL